jgi:Flp pilus assembly protein TadG
MISSIGSWFRRPVRSRFAKDSSGAAAVEFAMLLPIMFMLFYGTIEFSQALTVDRRVTQIASATADLVARTRKRQPAKSTRSC